MKTNAEKRTFERWNYSADIVFSYFNKKTYFDAQTLNHCTGGLCFKSSLFLKPGSVVYIRVKNFPPNGSRADTGEGLPPVTLAEVKWCKEVLDAENSAYGVGVKYFAPFY